MKKIKVQIKGTGKGLLMNSPLHMIENVKMESRPQMGRRENQILSPREQAEASAYWVTKGNRKELYLSSEAVFRSMINASSFHKIRKKSAKTTLAGAIRIEPDKIGLGTNKYEIDIRTVVIQRARVVKARALLPEWKVDFDIIYNDKLIGDSTETMRQILVEAGERIGVLDFRPQKGGQFGTFEVTKWLPYS